MANKKALMEFFVGFTILILIVVVSFLFYWNTPEKKLIRAFRNSFGARTIGYTINIDGNKYDIGNTPKSNYFYDINVSGSVVSNNFSGGLDIKEVDTKNDKKIGYKNAQMIIMGAGENQNYFELDKYTKNASTSKMLEDVMMGKWIESNNFVELRKKIDIDFSEIFRISSNVLKLNSDTIDVIKSELLEAKFINDGESVKSDDKNFSKIVFSINPIFAGDISSVIDKFAGIGVVDKQWLIDASWSAYLDRGGFVRKIIIKPEANKNLGRVKINNIVINFNSFNQNIRISKPNNFVREKDIINKIQNNNG